jgi:AcrR family transcriptional regulator
MARKTTRTHAQGETSRRSILESTVRIAGERGYVGATMAQIVRASGLPASSVYWHFRSKDELLADALEHGFRTWEASEPRWAATHEPPTAARIFHEFRIATDDGSDEPGFWRMGLLLSLETGPAVGSAPRNRFLKIRTDAIEVLKAWWTASLSPDGEVADANALALLTLAMLDGDYVSRQSRSEEDQEQIHWMVAHGLEAAAHHLLEKGAHPSAASARSRTAATSIDDTGRGQLLRAAAEVAAESGYDGATISRITQRAGVPASSLYWHFKDKDDLLGTVVEASYQEWSARQPVWLPTPTGRTWPEDLRAHLEVSLRSVQDNPAFLRIGFLLLLLNRTDPPSGRAVFLAVRQQAQLILADWFRTVLPEPQGTDPDLPRRLAVVMMVLSDGLFFSNQLDSPSWDVSLFADLATAVMEGAVRAPAELPTISTVG